MTLRFRGHRHIASVLIAALVPAPGMAWHAPAVDRRPGAGAMTRLERHVLAEALNSRPQATIGKDARPQIYLVFSANLAVPSVPMNVADTSWIDEFLDFLSTQGPTVATESDEAPWAREPRPPATVEPPRPFCNVPCVPPPGPAPVPARPPGEPIREFCNVPCVPAPTESILDEIEAAEAHIRSLPSHRALGNLPDSIEFERNPNENVPVQRTMMNAVSDAMHEAGMDSDNGSFKRKGDDTVVYEENAPDGDITITGTLVDGRIVLTREFRPLLGSGDVGDPIKVPYTGGARATTPTPNPAAAGDVNTAPADSNPSPGGVKTSLSTSPALPPGARAIPDEAVRQWGTDFYNHFLGQTATITGDRDDQGRLLGINGQVVAPSVLVALRTAQAGAVRDLNGFVGHLRGLQNASRDDKLALVRELQVKAQDVKKAWDALAVARETYKKDTANLHQVWKNNSQAAAQLEADAAAKLNQAKATYVNLLNATPLLGIEHDDEMLWQALTDKDRFSVVKPGADRAAQIAADQQYVELLNPYLAAGIRQTSEQANEMAAINDLETLAQFASPAYAGLRARIALMGQPIGSAIPADLMAELDAAANGALKNWTAEAWSDIIDKGLVVIAVGSIFIPFGPMLALAASGAQVIRSGDKLYVAYGEAADAQGRAAATGYEAVMQADGKLAMSAGGFFLDLGFGALDVLAAMKYAQAVQLARAERAAAAAEEAAINAIPRVAGARVVTDATSIVNRIDDAALAGRPRVGTPGDANFFREAGLLPEQTVEAGGQTFHLSRPFRGPNGRVGIIAFQEGADGKIIPRTFYLSGEHGVWRAATAGGGGLQKGPVRYFTADPAQDPRAVEITAEQANQRWMNGEGYYRRHVNESSADIAAELQGTLHRWTAERGVATLDEDVMKRAFMGHLEDQRALTPTEFGTHMTPDAAQTPFVLSGGARPDFVNGLRDRWTFQHPFYGNSEAFVYRSLDGNTVYLVIRDQQGRVFVPAIQNGSTAVTPFGTRTGAIQTDLSGTPIQHSKGQQGVPVGPDGEYIDVGDAYRNPVNDYFRDRLPPSPSNATTAPNAANTPAVRTPDQTPTVIEPGRLPRTGTFAPPGRAGVAAATGGDDILHVQTLVDARNIRNGNMNAMRPWTGQELERLRTLRNDPAQFRSEYRGKLTQQDLDAIDTLLRHYRIDPVTGRSLAVPDATPPPAAPAPSPRPNVASPAAAPPAPARAGAANEPVRISPVHSVDEILEGVINGREKGTPVSQLAQQAQAALARANLKPADLMAAMKARLSGAPRTVSMADLGNPATPSSLDVGLKAHGVSSGTAFTIEAVNRGHMPVVLQGEGIVVEPVPGAAPRQAPPASSPQYVTQDVEAFCLERQRPVASEGAQYRVAPPAVQAQHRGLVDVLHAAKRVADAGGLRPDSEFKGYFNFVRQWALWTKQEQFDEKRFTAEFIDQTKKNVEGQRVTWTKEMENVVRKAAPGRWRDVTAILEEANASKTGPDAAPLPALTLAGWGDRLRPSPTEGGFHDRRAVDRRDRRVCRQSVGGRQSAARRAAENRRCAL